VKQNIYDDPRFFHGYSRMREEGGGLNEVLEQPVLGSCLPPLSDLTVLDVGCGMGQLAFRCAEAGAVRVVACDISEKMLEVARRERTHPRITYVRRAAEDLDFPPGTFDLVVSSFALHYVADYARLVRRVADWLRPEGRFVYSVEHPIATAANPMRRGQKTRLATGSIGRSTTTLRRVGASRRGSWRASSSTTERSRPSSTHQWRLGSWSSGSRNRRRCPRSGARGLPWPPNAGGHPS